MEDVKVSIEMTIAQANTVLAALGKQPFEAVADIIASIRAQGSAQMAEHQKKQQEAASEPATEA
jgi:hypothetical protein